MKKKNKKISKYILIFLGTLTPITVTSSIVTSCGSAAHKATKKWDKFKKAAANDKLKNIINQNNNNPLNWNPEELVKGDFKADDANKVITLTIFKNNSKTAVGFSTTFKITQKSQESYDVANWVIVTPENYNTWANFKTLALKVTAEELLAIPKYNPSSWKATGTTGLMPQSRIRVDDDKKTISLLIFQDTSNKIWEKLSISFVRDVETKANYDIKNWDLTSKPPGDSVNWEQFLSDLHKTLPGKVLDHSSNNPFNWNQGVKSVFDDYVVNNSAKTVTLTVFKTQKDKDNATAGKNFNSSLYTKFSIDYLEIDKNNSGKATVYDIDNWKIVNPEYKMTFNAFKAEADANMKQDTQTQTFYQVYLFKQMNGIPSAHRGQWTQGPGNVLVDGNLVWSQGTDRSVSITNTYHIAYTKETEPQFVSAELTITLRYKTSTEKYNIADLVLTKINSEGIQKK